MEAVKRNNCLKTSESTPALSAATEPPHVKFIQTGNACVDRTTAYELLPLRHAERKPEARAIELTCVCSSNATISMRLMHN